MTKRLLRATGAALSMQLSIGATAVKAGILLPLSEQDRIEIDRAFGHGVLGEPIPAQGIADPSRFLDMTSGSRTYRVRGESGAEADQDFQLTPIAPSDGKPTWRYQQQGSENGFLEQQTDGSFVLTGVEDLQTGAVTRYAPAEPFLIAGMKPGESRNIRMKVRVFDSSHTDKVAHEGALDVVYRYVGAYRIVLPAGTYDAVLMKSTFHGTVGPARLEDIQYRFFAPGTGLVAAIEQRDVSAFLVYNTHLREAKLLALKN